MSTAQRQRGAAARPLAEPSSRRVALTGLALIAVTACARMGSPPGGPEDKVAPVLVATVPESTGSYPDWNRDVEFRFDEVISEGGQPNMGLGTGDLEKLILVSPSKGIPRIEWKRNRITVRPREGWKPNRVYRIELLPGLVDLRRNRLDTTKVITFTTGAPAPTDTLSGLVIDWVAGTPARQSLIELVLRPDSLVYRTVSDSSGRFSIGPLPRAEYLVYGAIDQNRNLLRERRENYDSNLVAAGAQVPTLWLIPRDTIGPRIQTATPADSTGAVLTMTQPLDPYQSLDSVEATLRLQSDSSLVPTLSLRTQQLDDTVQAQARALADSIRQASDTTIKRDTAQARRAPPAAVPPGRGRPGTPAPSPARLALDSIIRTRPPLSTRLVLRTRQPLAPDTKYIVELKGIRSAAGVASPEVRQILVVPKPPEIKADSAARADSALKVSPMKGDSLRTPKDSAPPVRLPDGAPKPKQP